MLARIALAAMLAVSLVVPAEARDCEVSERDRIAANETDWQTFDQSGGVSGTFRNLVSEGCHAEAIEAYRAWLEHNGGFPHKRAQGVGLFHIGQSLAFTGNRSGAIAMIERALRDEDDEGQPAVDWNAYVDGVLGYFAGDAARIRAAQDRLRSSGRAFAQRQTGVLEGLANCIDKPYREAMSAVCRD